MVDLDAESATMHRAGVASQRVEEAYRFHVGARAPLRPGRIFLRRYG